MKRLNFVLCLVCTLATSSAARADSAVAWGNIFTARSATEPPRVQLHAHASQRHGQRRHRRRGR